MVLYFFNGPLTSIRLSVTYQDPEEVAKDLARNVVKQWPCRPTHGVRRSRFSFRFFPVEQHQDR